MSKAIEIRNLSVNYGDIRAISNISLDIEKGDFLGIIGPNGGGKTTLLKAILGLVPVSKGSIEFFLKGKSGIKGSLGYVPQFANMDKRFPISVIEVVLTARTKRGLPLFSKYTEKDLEVAHEQLRRVGIEHLAKRQISELSGGEFQRLLIARALAINPQLLLLDEPTASVDSSSRERIFQILKELNKEITIVLVTHDLLAISSKVKKLACLNKTLVYHGETQLNQEIVNNLYGGEVEFITHDIKKRVLQKHEEE